MDKTQHAEINDKTCQNCRYCDSLVVIGQATITQVCRLKSPGVSAAPIGLDPATGQVKWVYTTLWPMVLSSDWCSEWQRKLQS